MQEANLPQGHGEKVLQVVAQPRDQRTNGPEGLPAHELLLSHLELIDQFVVVPGRLPGFLQQPPLELTGDVVGRGAGPSRHRSDHEE